MTTEQLVSPFAAYGTNKAKEKDGVWIDFGSFGFRVRRMGPSNKRFTVALEKIQRETKGRAGVRKMTDDQANRKLYEVFAHTILVDWRTNHADGTHTVGKLPGKEAGTFIDFSPTEAVALFEALPDLFADVHAETQNLALFQEQDEEDVAGK